MQIIYCKQLFALFFYVTLYSFWLHFVIFFMYSILLLIMNLKSTFYYISCREIFGTKFLWPQVLLLSGIISFVQLVTLPFFPESPIYLLFEKDDKEACQRGNIQLQVLVQRQNYRNSSTKCVYVTTNTHIGSKQSKGSCTHRKHDKFAPILPRYAASSKNVLFLNAIFPRSGAGS